MSQEDKAEQLNKKIDQVKELGKNAKTITYKSIGGLLSDMKEYITDLPVSGFGTDKGRAVDTGKQPEDTREAIEQEIAKPQITPVDETKKVDRTSVKEDLKKLEEKDKQPPAPFLIEDPVLGPTFGKRGDPLTKNPAFTSRPLIEKYGKMIAEKAYDTTAEKIFKSEEERQAEETPSAKMQRQLKELGIKKQSAPILTTATDLGAAPDLTTPIRPEEGTRAYYDRIKALDEKARAEAKPTYKVNENVVKLKDVGDDGFPEFVFTTRSGFDIKFTGKSQDEVYENAAEIDALLRRSGADKLSEIFPDSTSFTRSLLQAENDPALLIAAAQKNLQREYNSNVNNINNIADKYGIELNDTTVNLMAAATAIIQSPATTLAPAIAFGGPGNVVVQVLDTVLFPLNGLFTQVLVDAANMSQDNEIIRHRLASGEDYIVNFSPLYNVLNMPTRAQVDPDVAVITADEIKKMVRTRQDPNVAVGIMRDFLLGKGAVLMLSRPFKKGALEETARIHQMAVKNLEGRSKRGDVAPKFEQTYKGTGPGKGVFSQALVLEEMNRIFKKEQAEIKKSFLGGLGVWAKKTFNSQRYEYAINPKLWLKDIDNQELWFATGANATSWTVDKILNTPYEEVGKGSLLTEFVGGIMGVLGSTQLDLRNVVIQGVRYPVLGSLFVTTQVAGMGTGLKFAAPENFKLLTELLNPRLNKGSYREMDSYKKLSKEGKKEFNKIAKGIIKKRGLDPRFREDMDNNYMYMTQLKTQFDEVNKALPEGQKFTDEDITMSIATMYQSQYLRRLEQHIFAESQKRLGKKAKTGDHLELIEAMEFLNKERERLDDINQKILARLDVIPDDQAYNIIENFKQNINKVIDNDKADQNVRQFLIGRAAELHMSEVIEGHNFNGADSTFILDLIKKHDLIDEQDLQFVQSVGGLRAALQDLEKVSRITVVEATNQNRKYLMDMTAGSNNNMIKYEGAGLTNTGEIVKGTGRTLINELTDRAGKIKKRMQTAGRITVNNVLNWSTKRYGRLYDEAFAGLGKSSKVDITNEVLDIVALSREGGPLSQVPKVKSLFQKYVMRELDPQVKENVKIFVNTINKNKSEADKVDAQDIFNQIKKELREEQVSDMAGDFNIFDYVKKMKIMADEMGLEDVSFKISLDYKTLREIKRDINSLYEGGQGSVNRKIGEIGNMLEGALQNHHTKIIDEFGEQGKEVVKKLNEVNGQYRDWVLIKKEKSILYKLAENLQEPKGSGLSQEKIGETLEKNLLSQTKGKIPEPEFDLEQALKNPNKDFFDELFANYSADDIHEGIIQTFGTPVRYVEAGVEKTRYVPPVKGAKNKDGDLENPFYETYDAFLKQMDVYVASRTAESLDKAKLEGTATLENLLSLNFVKEDDIDKLLDKGFNFQNSPGIVGSENNLEFFNKVRQINKVSGGKMLNVQKDQYDVINQWASANTDNRIFLNEALQEGAKVIKTQISNMSRATSKVKSVIESINNTKQGIMNLKDAESVLDFAIQNKGDFANAREYAIRGGMSQRDFDEGVKLLVVKGMIGRFTRLKSNGKIKFRDKPLDVNDLQKQNLNASGDVLKTNKNVDIVTVPNKAIEGTGLDDYIEQNYEALSKIFGEQKVVLKHMQILARISRAIARDGDDDLINLSGDGTLNISLQGLQSRLWAIASNRASYHYVMAEVMLSFIKNRDADSLLAFAMADKDYTAAFTKAIVTGDTSIFGTRKLQAPAYFVARAITLGPIVQGAFIDLEKKEGEMNFNEALAMFFINNPEKDPYAIFKNKVDPNSQLGKRMRVTTGAPLGKRNLDLSSFTQRSMYVRELIDKFISLRENPKEGESIEQLFERAYEELRALKAGDEDSKFQLP